MSYIDYFILIFFILLIILLIKDINTPRPKNTPFLFTQIIYLLFNPKNIFQNQINSIKDYETFNHYLEDEITYNQHSKNEYKNNFNHILKKFNFIIFVFLFIFVIVPFIIYMTRNSHHTIPISIFIIIILIIGPTIFKFFIKAILFLLNTPLNYLYNTKKRKKNIITI